MPEPADTLASVGERLYLDLLKKCLTRSAFGEPLRPIWFPKGTLRSGVYGLMRKVLRVLTSQNLELAKRGAFDLSARAEGRDWPAEAETMVGLKRLDNLEECIRDVLRRGVPGDLIETGVWRGGATIFMRAVLKVHNETQRVVWAADSFCGLPKPNPELYPADADDRHWTYAPVAASLDEVKANFARYGLLDDQVRFLVGWFQDTLPSAPVEKLALARLDGDMYESTIVALRSLYPKLSAGGYLIVDDYSNAPGCKKAVDDFRREQGITEELRLIDYSGAFWQRLK